MTRSNVEHLQNEVFLLKVERDAYFEDLQRLRRLHVYALVERDWYREACEECWRFNPSNKY